MKWNEWKPCPNCGGSASLHHRAGLFWVRCGDCKTASGARGTANFAISDWNSLEGTPLDDVWEAVNNSQKPIVVCLCGSTRFRNEFLEATRSETLAGKIVLSVGFFGHHEKLDPAGETKQMLDRLHLKKIDMADEILVLNVGGYIGTSTKNEILYASKFGKRVRYLEGLLK